MPGKRKIAATKGRSDAMPGKQKIAATNGRSGAMRGKRKTPANRGRPDDTGTTGCVFCFSDEADKEEIFGTYIKTDAICVHSNCLYFASGLSQRGNDSDELLGFLLPDIQAEVKRGRKLSCAYCKKRGATVGCYVESCKKSFHLNCGIDHASLHQFFGNFRSYCKNHKPRQPKRDIKSISCCICRELITDDAMDFCLYPPCCAQSLFHKMCIQKTALNSGWYYFKCPLCRNEEDFVREMQLYGINIPIQDASWERDEDAYNDLLVRPECDAPFCKCPQGRSHQPAIKSTWGLLVCSHCGFHARHKPCENLKKSESKWMCEECSNLNDNISKLKACSEIGDESGTCANNVCMSPKVVIKKMTDIHGIYCDSLLKSDSHKVKLYQSYVTYSKASKSIDASEVVKSGKVIKSEEMPIKSEEMPMKSEEMPIKPEEMPVAGSSKQVTERPEISPIPTKEVSELVHIPTVTNKLFNRVVNFRDIKNFTHSSPFKQIKTNIKTKFSKKVCKRLKVDNQSCGISGQALITSYFGHNNEKNIRL